MNFSERLQKALDDSGVKAGQLAETLHWRPSRISNYLTGNREPDNEAMAEIAKSLRISHAWLAGFTDEQKVLTAISASKGLAGLSENLIAGQTNFGELIKHNLRLQTSLREAEEKIRDAADSHAFINAIIRDLTKNRELSSETANEAGVVEKLASDLGAADDHQNATKTPKPPTASQSGVSYPRAKTRPLPKKTL